MDLRALTLLASLFVSSARAQGPEAIGRFDEALAAAERESDETVRARARVEIRYRAGDLPGALREALEGLRSAPMDLVLLRRAVELETALRLPELARSHSSDLERAVSRETLDADARRWWERQVAVLSEEADRLQEHQAELEAAILRARWVCFMALGAVVLGAVLLNAAARSRTNRERAA
jgi:hypothetical protein